MQKQETKEKYYFKYTRIFLFVVIVVAVVASLSFIALVSHYN